MKLTKWQWAGLVAIAVVPALILGVFEYRILAKRHAAEMNAMIVLGYGQSQEYVRTVTIPKELPTEPTERARLYSTILSGGL